MLDIKEKLSVPDSLKDTANNDRTERFCKTFSYLCIANYPEISDFQSRRKSCTCTICELVGETKDDCGHIFIMPSSSLVTACWHGVGGAGISFQIDTHHACTGVEEEGFYRIIVEV